MELKYFILFIWAYSSVVCADKTCINGNNVLPLKVYGAYLIGFTMLIMLIVIICLAVALYMVKCNKTILGITLNRKPTYIRQESGHGVTLCNVTSSNNINDQYKNDGSTLTVNSGIVEIGGLNEPETPTRTEIKEENRITYKKPVVPIFPTMQKSQMDDVLREVLNRKQKSDSAILRELDALTHPKNSPSLEKLASVTDESTDECLYENTRKIFMQNEIKKPIKEKLDSADKKQTQNLTKKDIQNDTVDGVNGSKPDLAIENNEDEQEVYDTVPNPVRCNNSDSISDEYIENLHVYDLPPRKSWENNEGRNVVMDHDTQYLLPLSNRPTENQDRACYINAKLRDSH